MVAFLKYSSALQRLHRKREHASAQQFAEDGWRGWWRGLRVGFREGVVIYFAPVTWIYRVFKREQRRRERSANGRRRQT